jgi:LacI family repressor for deo operon, udp, cdd, tsx, nupC, and nupG
MISIDKPKIKDVAKTAGVSVATVSAVINQRRSLIPVSESTRAKVLQAVKKLNYQVNEQARALRRGRSNTIGVVASDITQPFSGQMLKIVQQAVRDRGYHFLVADSNNSAGEEMSNLQIFMQKKVEGILFLSVPNDEEDEGVQMLVDNNIPVVLTERHAKERNVPAVLVDNTAGVVQAVEHLIDHGHERIGYISGPRRNCLSEERHEGYYMVLDHHGLPYEESLVAEGGLTLEDGFSAMQELLDQPEPPTAVFAFNDATAIGAMRAIREKGFSIPGQVAIIGFDDIPMAEYCEPGLTTVRQPVDRMCREGVRVLLDILEGQFSKDFSDAIVLDPELIIRRSCGCTSHKKEHP